MADVHKLSVVTYNLHGLNQGYSFLASLCMDYDIVFTQEHWLASFDLNRLYNICDSVICFASSAMDDVISKDCLRGRPFGGVAIFVQKHLAAKTKLIKKESRYIIIQVGQTVFVNVYLPSASAYCREDEFVDCLASIVNDIVDLQYSDIVFGGDMNIDFASPSNLCSILLKFAQDHDLKFVYDRLPDDSCTFRVEATGATSLIDHFAVSQSVYSNLLDVQVLDSGINLSDHCPVAITVDVSNITCTVASTQLPSSKQNIDQLSQLRWDRCDVTQYFWTTYEYLTGVSAPTYLLYGDTASSHTNVDVRYHINAYYNSIVNALQHSSYLTVPVKKKGFYKYWWDEELSLLKEKAIESFNIWISTGKPRAGVAFNEMRRDKAAYKLAIRRKEKGSKEEFSDSLNDALMHKDMDSFWKSWRSKFGNKSSPSTIDGLFDEKAIADRFASVFESVSVPNSLNTQETLKSQFFSRYDGYVGLDCGNINVDLVVKCIDNLKKGKAPGLDGLMAEHIFHAHPVLSVHLSLLFAILLRYSITPDAFGHSVVIPLLKNPDGNQFTSDNYRAITLSPVISKIFEMTVMMLIDDKLDSDPLQFGFKRNSSCNHALLTLRTVINHYVKNGSTVNICALDLSKAFDKVNHFALLQLLMDRHISKNIIGVLLDWFIRCFVCVRWGGSYSYWFCIHAGVRQGGILSPALFAVFMDVLIVRLRQRGLGCKLFDCFYGCLVYADDILLLAHTVTGMQEMLRICDEFAIEFDMKFNSSKSVATRIGYRYNVPCSPFILSGNFLKYVTSVKYLGIYFVAAKCFKLSVDHLKVKFYRVFNCIYSKVKASNRELVVVHLLKSYCLPFLLYASEAVSPCYSHVQSLDNCVNRAIYKIFGLSSNSCVEVIRQYVGIPHLKVLIENRRLRFVDRLLSCNQCNNLFLANVPVIY